MCGKGEVERLGNSTLKQRLGNSSVNCSLAFPAFAFSSAVAFQTPPRSTNWDQSPGSCLLLLVFCGPYTLKAQQLATGSVSLKKQVVKVALPPFPCHLTGKAVTPPQTRIKKESSTAEDGDIDPQSQHSGRSLSSRSGRSTRLDYTSKK